MQPVNTNAGFYIEKQFVKRNIVFELKISRKFFGFENKFILYKIGSNSQNQDATNNVPDKMRENWLWFLIFCFWLDPCYLKLLKFSPLS